MKTSVGLDVKPPEKACEDPNCAWHGKLPIRGKVFWGIVRSAKAHNTVTVRWSYNKYVRKYERYERRHSSVTAHSPPCIHAKEKEKVIIAECRPVSKTKKFVVIGRW